jgi:hypothetical protein
MHGDFMYIVCKRICAKFVLIQYLAKVHTAIMVRKYNKSWLLKIYFNGATHNMKNKGQGWLVLRQFYNIIKLYTYLSA